MSSRGRDRASISGQRRRRCGTVLALLLGTGGIVGAQTGPTTPPADDRGQQLAAEIGRLERELAELQGRERGVLGELERLATELRLREKELEEVGGRLDQVARAIEEHDRALAGLEQARQGRRAYLAFRLREIYKAGPDQLLWRLLRDEAADPTRQGVGYASYLSERDGRVLESYREDAAHAADERAALEQARAELAGAQAEASRSREAVDALRRRQATTLRRLREDQTERRAALDELQAAAAELSGVVTGLPESEKVGELDVRKFRGLLERPADGRVSAGFGRAIHPQFGTELPHPGWDIEAPFGADVRCVFDGQVVFAEWMRGYGLTVLVDHGQGVLSIYAHASLLLVERGERVQAGQLLAKVGDTGSLRGAFLYFVLRVDGEPTDPAGWLRPG
jgi:septal ring factor EnvC (AmiA/AmiB activator)